MAFDLMAKTGNFFPCPSKWRTDILEYVVVSKWYRGQYINLSSLQYQLFLTSQKKVKVLVIQSCLIPFDPLDCSPPGSSVHGILQARILEWVAIPFSRDLPDPKIELGSSHCRQILYHLRHHGSHSYMKLHFLNLCMIAPLVWIQTATILFSHPISFLTAPVTIASLFVGPFPHVSLFH